jgi:NADP-dependent 3-hydroxy acid dehydrogenase YdfG
MNRRSTRTAVIVGASFGIGEALAYELNRAGWRLCLLARRLDRLKLVRKALAPDTVVRGFDVTQADAASALTRLLDEFDGVGTKRYALVAFILDRLPRPGRGNRRIE